MGGSIGGWMHAACIPGLYMNALGSTMTSRMVHGHPEAPRGASLGIALPRKAGRCRLTPTQTRNTVSITGGGTVLSIRLPDSLKRELERLAAEERTTKTQIVRRALERYVEAHRDQRSSYELGEALFGRHGSGESTRSTNYKRILREKLRAKHPG